MKTYQSIDCDTWLKSIHASDSDVLVLLGELFLDLLLDLVSFILVRCCQFIAEDVELFASIPNVVVSLADAVHILEMLINRFL